MTPYDALRPYIDEVGLVQNWKGRVSGNGLLYTAEAVVRLHALGQLAQDMKDGFLRAVVACQIQPGFYRRHPVYFSSDQERQDDYIAIAVLAKYLDAPWLAQEVLDYGQRPKLIFPPLPWPKVRYYYPNEKGWDAFFYPQAWIGAYPACIATLKVAAGVDLSDGEQDWLNYAVGYGPNKKDVTDRDSYILAWLISTVVEVSKEATEEFEARLAASYGTIPNLLRTYFDDKNHPLGDVWAS